MLIKSALGESNYVYVKVTKWEIFSIAIFVRNFITMKIYEAKPKKEKKYKNRKKEKIV